MRARTLIKLPTVEWLRHYWFPEVRWEPRDLWVGVHWSRWESKEEAEWGWSFALDVYVCVIPCVPVHLAIRRMVPSPAHGVMQNA